MAAYYNEFDKQAAQWLRNLIAAGHIAPGDVDDRSIADVSPDDLRGYTQCHFFAGVGVWSYALRRAGWPDDRPVWTGSAPCQPFSAAGGQLGFDDERHLWPAFAWLIEQCRPPVVFGEQVASKAVEPWVDLVHADLEAILYAFGAVPFPSASVGAPHIRDRLYWAAERLADASCDGPQGGLHRRPDTQWQIEHRSLGCLRAVDGLAYSGSAGSFSSAHTGVYCGQKGARAWDVESERPGPAGGLADLHSYGRDQGRECEPTTGRNGPERDGSIVRLADADLPVTEQLARSWPGPDEAQGSGPCGQPYGRRELYRVGPAGPTNGLWGDVDWLFCRDGKWRPVEPGSLPLAHGATSRVVRLRAYGNAINAEQATVFIEAFLEGQAERVLGRSDLTYLDELI